MPPVSVFQSKEPPFMPDTTNDDAPSPEKERKQEIVEGWAFPEEDTGNIHHFYRGELGRANVWRTRLDTTTNWAVATTGVLISVAFSSSSISHSILLAGIPVVLLFLYIEARRFRKYDLYRSRVRLLEENYYSTLFSSEKGEHIPDWQNLVAKSLHTPTFQLRFSEAVSARIRRTYIFLLAILTGVWGLKLIIHPTPARHWREVVRRAGIAELIPYWLNLVIWGVLWTVLLFFAFWRPAPLRHREGRPAQGKRWSI